MHIKNTRTKETAATRYYKGATKDNWTAFAVAAALIAGLAALLVLAHFKRAERDSRVEMQHAHYELMAVTGGVK